MPETAVAERGAAPATSALEIRPIDVDSELRLDASELPSAFTVDVEDWYQSCVDLEAPISDRVVRNVHRMLEMLDAVGVKGTFFVQGRVAEAYPALLQELVAEGHEIQSHGHSHRSLAGMSREELRRELEYGRKTVEDASGQSVTAFRAPDFSILEGNLWALDALAEAGFKVDSSIFPGSSRRYGIPGWELAPHRVALPGGAEMLEVPVAIWQLGGVRLPVAGGGYLRLLPLALVERGLRAVRAQGRPAILYCHPYEFSSGELGDYRGLVPAKRLLSQGLGRGALVRRMTRLLQALPFGRFDHTLSAWGISAESPS